ncbi:MAG TPA: hypothetical protein VGH99_04285 [Pseudonocardia sp.]|jgi:hypothetical protein
MLHHLPRNGIGGQRLLDQMAAVLDPIAAGHSGEPAHLVRSALGRAWREAFGTALPEITLDRCARAIEERRSWEPVLWGDYESRPPFPTRIVVRRARPAM